MYRLTISRVDLTPEGLPSGSLAAELKRPTGHTETTHEYTSAHDAWTAAVSYTSPDQFGRGYMYALADTHATGSCYAHQDAAVMATVTRID